MTKVLLVGATGLVGAAIVNQCPHALTVLTRRQVPGGPLPPRMALRIADPVQWSRVVAAEAPDVLISCLGTTIKAAGSQAAFRAVDHDLVIAVAGAARAAGATQCITVSSVGASLDSSNFYLCTKAEGEAGLRDVGFARLDILRPGLLIGDRSGPLRLGEAAAQFLAPVTDTLLHGALRRYRSVRAETVAAAIVALTRTGGDGVHIHEHDAIVALAN
jgi:uncharacterized protein YbjT (DUF2867 family)